MQNVQEIARPKTSSCFALQSANHVTKILIYFKLKAIKNQPLSVFKSKTEPDPNHNSNPNPEPNPKLNPTLKFDNLKTPSSKP